MFSENLESFAGKRVEDFAAGTPLDPATTIPRLRVEYDATNTAVDLFGELLASGVADRLTGLVIGAWSSELYENSPAEIMEAMIVAADQLPGLRALFLGDITYQENEVSWIQQTSLSPLWTAFPRLEILGIRGSNGLSLGQVRHNHLKQLTIECGGLPKSVLEEIAAATLPALEHLELYLGDSGYGWDGTVADVEPLLSTSRFPKLKYLGLRNSEIADEVAAAAARAPILQQLEVLDLSLGTLGDDGGEALLGSAGVKRLKKLDLHRHYMSPALVSRLEKIGITVDVSDVQEGGEDDRYVSVGE